MTGRPLPAVGVALVLVAAGCGTRVAGPAQPVASSPPVLSTPTAAPATPWSPADSGEVDIATRPGTSPPTGGPARSARPPSEPAAVASPTTIPAGDARPGTRDPARERPAPVDPAAPAAPPAAGTSSVAVIGTVSTLSGPGGTVLVAGVEAVQAWVRRTNDRGGLRGHPVRYVVADDGGDPARHRALVQQLVQRDHVIAFVQKQEPFAGASIAPYHREIGVPVIGTEGGGDYVYSNPMYFPVAASGDEAAVAQLAAVGRRADEAGLRRFGVIYCAEAPNCSDYVRVWTGPRGRDRGFDFVYQARASVAQPDFTAECLGARQAGVQLLSLLMDANSMSRIAASCARQGYRPRFFVAMLSTAASLPADPNLDGMLIGAQVFAWPAGDTPARREFLDVMATYRKGAAVTGGHALGWVAAKVFERAGAALGEPPTTTAVLDGLWAIHDEDLGGLTAPLTYRRGQPAARQTCASVVRIGNGRFEAPWGGGVTCFSG